MKLITVACVNLLLLAKAAKQYVATFTSDGSGIVGTVTVDMGQVSVDLDLSGVVDSGLPKNFSYCTGAGLSYHIHKIWTHNEATDTTVCGPDYTAGHWDPWHACGAASGNEYCGDGNGTTCIPKADYDPDFSADPFSAEVGDWSSKYGKVTVDSSYMASTEQNSFYEVLPGEMDGLSVVFHCGTGGNRAFCAPFLESTEAVSATVPDQDNEKVVVARFAELSEESMIILAPNGTIMVNVDATTGGDLVDSTCTEFEYSIFEAGSLTEGATGDGCSGVGQQYDPTDQCLPWSNSEYCTAGELCDDSGYVYSCDFTNQRYSCAPGDLSGKMGELIGTSAVYSKTLDGNTLIPPTDTLIGKVIGINCGYSSSNDIKFVACGIIEEYEDDGSAAAISFIMATVVSFIALLF
eukprot:CAMPEP_0201567358 /NCGR_PEP_ID=MMETSP0190_2-20130828/7849_1 /ASSEMBLY_ACC=CAM_ASM_000263 /TAXON_ID=37353 /ORGANISM="Rosalina sp." /LENGTH=406 /DNA_ID=CAMNT_0047987263 /DNA_START=69 /DNA_END=1289 /DNA_ORIENTATION=+